MPLPIGINPSDLTKLPENVQIIYKATPFYLTWQFAVAVILFIACIVIGFYAWFRISLRNRTNVILHMPDKSRKLYTFKHFTGTKFEIEGMEKDKDNNFVKYVYFFRADAVEIGYFGKYIEYDYGNSEPRKFMHTSHELDTLFISSLLNTQLAVDLLLSSKWKEFVKTMLIVIVIMVLIVIVFQGGIIYQLFFTPHQNTCSLELTNQTIETWKTLQRIH